ncbi:hypothetical protein VE02_00208 [Pseudogymnoascus sp. 03VT05]|nr:hypothetical protein VE02_00208 [Pseudogymnoascus sp. 03VT05]
MLSHIFKSLVMVLAFGAGTVSSQSLSNSLVSRRLTEYLMPAASETHEFARVPGTNFVLLSQMYDSQLIKIELNPITEEPIASQSFLMGKNSKSGLHGWENRLLLVDLGQNLSAVSSIIKTINILEPGNGPHCIFEIGNRVWAGLKDASKQTGQYYVFSADISNPTDQKLYPCLKSPVFIKEEPATKLIYVTQDTESSIMRINSTSGETAQLPISPNFGSTPFSLDGNATGGSGSFGYIVSTGDMRFFQLKKPYLGTNAGLLHIADASTVAGGPALWLLSTSLLSTNSADALILVTFDEGVKKITGEEYISMLTQNAMVHRVVPLESTVLVSQLHTFALTQLSYNNTVSWHWLPAEALSNAAAVYTEAS